MVYLVTDMIIDRGDVTKMTEVVDTTGIVMVMTEEGVTDVTGAIGVLIS